MWNTITIYFSVQDYQYDINQTDLNMNKIIYSKIISEQFNINDLDFNEEPDEYDVNILSVANTSEKVKNIIFLILYLGIFIIYIKEIRI